jgi:hypothetical protein
MVGILWTSIVGDKKLKSGLAMDSPARMDVIAELVMASKLRPVMSETTSVQSVIASKVDACGG